MKKFICELFILILTFCFLQLPVYASSTTENSKTGIIYIGDSRFVGMNNCTKASSQPNTWVVAKVGQGYVWYKNNAIFQVDKIKSQNPDIDTWYEVYGLGINDLGNLDKYTKSYSERAKDNNLILLSVNPVEYHQTIANSSVEAFNQGLIATKLPYIDTYTYLSAVGYSTVDGLHYTNKTYNDIFEFVNNAIKKSEDI